MKIHTIFYQSGHYDINGTSHWISGTYKLKKKDLQAEGFNKGQVKDPLYFLDVKDSKYVSLTDELYGDIISGSYRL